MVGGRWWVVDGETGGGWWVVGGVRMTRCRWVMVSALPTYLNASIEQPMSFQLMIDERASRVWGVG